MMLLWLFEVNSFKILMAWIYKHLTFILQHFIFSKIMGLIPLSHRILQETS